MPISDVSTITTGSRHRRIGRRPFFGLVNIAFVLAACGSDGAAPPTVSVSDDNSSSAPATGPSPDEAAAERIVIAGDEALVWGDGPEGIVLAHGSAFDASSWEAQAVPMAELGFTVVAVENTSTSALESAIHYLRTDLDGERITLIGGSSGADSILSLLSEQPGLSDSLILLSPNRTVDGLDSQPKLFIASEDEPVADVSTQLADTSPGDDNVALILTGRAHAQNIFDSDQADFATEAILDRLSELATR